MSHKCSTEAGKAAITIWTIRSGMDLSLSWLRSNAWFTYYYWLDDAACRSFARTVDIHRKPGYDPVELFLDPQLAALPKLKIAASLATTQTWVPDIDECDSDGCDPGERISWLGSRAVARGGDGDDESA